MVFFNKDQSFTVTADAQVLQGWGVLLKENLISDPELALKKFAVSYVTKVYMNFSSWEILEACREAFLANTNDVVFEASTFRSKEEKAAAETQEAVKKATEVAPGAEPN